MPILNNILEAVGHTPTVRLNRMNQPSHAQIIVKYEGLNVGGSIKTRTALNMIEAAERRGEIIPGKTKIVEPTSGNQGIGLALVGAVKGYDVTAIMPDSVSGERFALMKHYGANIVLVPDKGDIGECIENCVKKAQEIKDGDPDVFIPQQFENRNNPEVHRLRTASEILSDIDCPIDGFCSGIGTGGTLTGIGEVLRDRFPNIKIWAVEPENAAVLAGGGIGTHLQMGIGDGIIPKILNTSIYDDICIISDDEALKTAQRLARLEGLMCGISSGSNVAAALKMAKVLGEGKTVFTVLPDTAERYFSTALFSD